ncbi:MAG: hypothetical protein Q4B46_12675, partial [Comamonadaceae bacterium]|nr:hypothetical protein [Comamonadaceae bacterium]
MQSTPIQTHFVRRSLALRPITMAAAMLCGGWTMAQAQSLEPSAAEHQLQSVEVSATGLPLGVTEMAAPV